MRSSTSAQAWLQFQFNDVPEGTLLRSEALFKPSGLVGDLYWWAMHPVHIILFTGMLRAIAAQAERSAGSAIRSVSAGTD